MTGDTLEQIEIPDLAQLELANSSAQEEPRSAKYSDSNKSRSNTDSSRNGSGFPLNREEEEKPTAEYALHILFTRFVRYTEKRLAKLEELSEDATESIFGEGVEPEFDMILESLGHVARRRPKPVIDSIMYWLQTKRDKPGGKSLATLYVLCRALMEVITQAPHDVLGEKLSEKLEEIVFNQLMSADPEVVNFKSIGGANWRYLARLLGEMSSFRPASVDDRFIAELEKKVTSKAQEARACLLLEAMRYLKIKLYPEEFLEESSVFLESLAKFYVNTPYTSVLRAKYATAICQILEPLAEAITVEVNQPMWAATMQTLFKTSQGKSTFSGLAGRTSSSAGQSSSSSWSSTKPAFSLSVMSLCLSPQPIFSENWFKLLETNVQKYKTKPLKTINLLPAAARLTWVYMFRCGESLNLTTKRIEALRRLFLSNSSRKYWQAIDSDKEARTAAISLVRSCFQGYQQYTLDEVLFRLLVGTDATSAQLQGIAYDTILPERACIAVDAFVELMKDLKTGNRPPFPFNSASPQQVAVYDGLSGVKESSLANSELPHRPVVPQALMASIDLFGTCVGEISGWLENNSMTLEPSSRQNSVSHLVSLASGNSNSTTSQSVESQRNELGIRTTEHYLLLLFLKSWPSWWKPEQLFRFLDVLSRCVGHEVPAIRNAAVESFRDIARTADLKAILTPFSKAMMAADNKNAELSSTIHQAPSSSIATSNKLGDGGSSGSGNHGHSFSFGSRGALGLGLGLGFHATSNSHDFDSMISRNGSDPNASPMQQHPDHLVLAHLLSYVELIEEWVSRLQNGDAAVPSSSVESQLLSLWAAVEEIEGNGLYFFCSKDMEVRSQGLRILWLTTTMDQAILNYKEAHDTSGKKETKPLRVINLLQNTPISQVAQDSNSNFDFNGPELQRLAMFGSKRASLARLAESRFGVDTSMWRKLFPSVISLCFESHPIPMALCRNLVVDRLSQMYDVVHEIACRSGGSQLDFTTVGIIEQWKIYLIVACATLTSTEEQKLYIPAVPNSGNSSSSVSMHSKKPSQKLTLHHKRITSVKSVFRIVVPMLKSEKNTVREAMVAGLSCTNVNTYKTLFECLQPVLTGDIQRLQQIHQSSHVKSTAPMSDPLLRSVTCITQVLTQTTNLLKTKEIRQDIWIRTEIISVLLQLRELLGSMKSVDVVPLRISFCELLADAYNTLKPSLMFYGRNPAQEWLLFRSIIECWSPFGVNAGYVLEQRNNMKRCAQNDVVLAQLEVMNRELDRATSRAMAALFVESQGFISDLAPALHWVYTLLVSSSHPVSQDIGRIALENLLVSHASRPEILLDVIGRCYHNTSERSRGVAKIYFVALVNILESHSELIKSKVDKPQQFLALALFKIGDPDSETRFRAVKLIEIVEIGLYGGSVLSGEYQFKLRSSSPPSVYKREIFVLSGKLASKRRQESYYLFSQMTRAFRAVNDSDRRDILSVLLPWIQNIEFKVDDDYGLQMVLVNLLEITALFSGRMQHEVEALWIALCTSNTGIKSNALRILDFLLSFCLQYRSPGSVAVSRTVLIYLLASPASSAITEKLLSYLEPKYMITKNGKPMTELVSETCSKEYPYVASLVDIVNLANESEGKDKNKLLPSFSYGQLAVVFLVDTISTSTPIISQLASLLHVCVVLGDHFVALVQDKTRELLLNLGGMFNPEPGAMRKLNDSVGNLRWRYEDDSGTVPDQLGELVSIFINHLNSQDVLDSRDWAHSAIKWATTCPVRHIACRSLQIYRCLDLQLDLPMLGDVLARLSNTISEQAVEIQGFATQILMTLNSIIDKLSPQELVTFPSLFWAAVASLSTANEHEYIEALSAVNKLLSKWSNEFSWAADNSFPSRWECEKGAYAGVMNLILRGLRSQNAAELSHEVANKLIIRYEHATESDKLLLFGNKNALPQLFASSVPWMLNAMDLPHLIMNLIEPAQALRRMVTPHSSGLVRILESFEKRRLWSKPDFLRQYFLALTSAFPDESIDVMILVMSMVNNGTRYIRKAALDILHTLVPEVNIHAASSQSKWSGADLIAPLLRLLTTPDVEEALRILDIFGSLKPDRTDKDVLRMTLGSRQLFHEYENTETLFGIPDESGWSVPMPAQASMITKANVHAVFYTCVSNESMVEDVYSFENQQNVENGNSFQLEEYGLSNNNMMYAQNAGQNSANQFGFGSMDKILTDLDEFDSFFTRAAAPLQSPVRISGSSMRSSSKMKNQSNSRPNSHEAAANRTNNGAPASSMLREMYTPPRNRSTSESESIPQLYDKKVSLILNQSLARTPSQVSFRASFSDFGRQAATQVPGGGTMPSGAVQPSHLRQNSAQSRMMYGSMNYDLSANSLGPGHRQRSYDSTTTIGDSQDFDYASDSLHRSLSRTSGYSNYTPSLSELPLPNSQSNSQQSSGQWSPLLGGPFPSAHISVAGPSHASQAQAQHNQSYSGQGFSSTNYSGGPDSLQTPLAPPGPLVLPKRGSAMESYDFFAGPEETSPHTPSSVASKKKAKKSPKTSVESSFRLESLLRRKRRVKSGGDKDKSPVKSEKNMPHSNSETFQFPPR